MASAAEFTVLDVSHVYIVGAGAHLETNFSVTYIAFETDAMKPVRKDDRTHPGPFSSLVDYHIPVLGIDRRWNKQRE